MKLSDYVAAFERGEAVECRSNHHCIWGDMDAKRAWYQADEYRMKPKPAEVWVNFYNDAGQDAFLDEKTARSSTSHEVTRIAVHMIEAP